MSTCPYCHRRLLTQASACCNWCGKEIPDAAYQQEAGAKREAFFVEQAMHDAASLAGVEALNVGPLLGPLTGLPLRGGYMPRRPPNVLPPALPPVQAGQTHPPAPGETPPPTEEPPAEPDSGDRFNHLEL